MLCGSVRLGTVFVAACVRSSACASAGPSHEGLGRRRRHGVWFGPSGNLRREKVSGPAAGMQRYLENRSRSRGYSLRLRSSVDGSSGATSSSIS